MIDYFIRAEAASDDVVAGDNDAIDVSHTHTTTTRGNHAHGIGSVRHKHWLPSSGSVYKTGSSKNENNAGNAWTGGNWYSSASIDGDAVHDHVDFGDAELHHSHTVSGSTGQAPINKNIPAYYSVIVIQKRV